VFWNLNLSGWLAFGVENTKKKEEKKKGVALRK
jgi:hypothetical protein